MKHTVIAAGAGLIVGIVAGYGIKRLLIQSESTGNE
jgi:uncharacterized membrane-anchored protein YhcB (DUF1043 family)